MAGEQLSLIPYGTDELILGYSENNADILSICYTNNGCYTMFYWYNDTGVETISYYIDSNKGSLITNYIKNGITAWSNASDFYTLSRVYSSSYASVCVYPDNYGSTGWDGVTVIYYYTEGGILVSTQSATDNFTDIHSARINLNASTLPSDTNSVLRWKAVSCHEMGHVLGLNHHSYSCAATTTTQTIMHEQTSHYYDSLGILSPKTLDINNISNYYSWAYYE